MKIKKLKRIIKHGNKVLLLKNSIVGIIIITTTVYVDGLYVICKCRDKNRGLKTPRIALPCADLNQSY